MNTIHAPHLPDLEFASVGAPITRGGVSLVPVYLHRRPTSDAPTHDRPTGIVAGIVTGTDASVTIGEQPDAEVPTLLAENHGDSLALLVSGQVVEGGLQTRVLNVSVLLDRHGRLPIPVSCVERGRWNGGSQFQNGTAFAPRRVRRAKDASVGENLRSGGSKRSDQGAVWNAVAHELVRLDVADASHRLSAAEVRLADDTRLAAATDELRTLGPLPGQCGVVVTHGSRIVSVEVFATPEMLAAHWPALVNGIMLDAPQTAPTSTPSLTRALRFVRRLGTSEATVTPGVGLGREHHVRTSRMVGQALVLDDMIVHASAFALAA